MPEWESVGRAPGEPVAIVDIGSNSVRLVAYEALTRAPNATFNEKVLCGLGRGVSTTGFLAEEAVTKALSALRRFRILCDIMEIRDVRALATAAVRDAASEAAQHFLVECRVGRARERFIGDEANRVRADIDDRHRLARQTACGFPFRHA